MEPKEGRSLTTPLQGAQVRFLLKYLGPEPSEVTERSIFPPSLPRSTQESPPFSWGHEAKMGRLPAGHLAPAGRRFLRHNQPSLLNLATTARATTAAPAGVMWMPSGALTCSEPGHAADGTDTSKPPPDALRTGHVER